MAEEPENANIPGQWHGPLSLQPLKEVVRFVKDCDDYTKERRADAGSAVFKAHPGIKSTFITDMTGLEFVFGAAPDVLDRLDGEPGFGGLSFNCKEMLGGVVPALMTHDGSHEAARAIIVEAMKVRRDFFAPACQKILAYGIPMLRTPARGVEVNFQHAMHHAAIGICFDWLFGITPGPSGAEAQSWIKGCFGMKSDQPLANAIARRVSRSMNGPTAAQRKYGERSMAAIRESKPYQHHFLDIGRRLGIAENELAAHLMFAASFNATGGAWSTLHPALAQLSVDDVTRERLAAELIGFDGTVWQLNNLPFLHDFFLEAMRLYGRPRHYYRRTKTRVQIPVSIGPAVWVDAGTTLCLVATVARQDRTVWGDDASVFDPERYGRNPELRGRVYPFGPPAGAKNDYGCAAAENGIAAILWKTLAAAVARSTDWKLTPWPEPDVDAFDGVRPAEFNWVRP